MIVLILGLIYADTFEEEWNNANCTSTTNTTNTDDCLAILRKYMEEHGIYDKLLDSLTYLVNNSGRATAQRYCVKVFQNEAMCKEIIYILTRIG